MERVLLVGNDKTVENLLREKIVSQLGFEVFTARSYKETVELLAEKGEEYLAGILGYNLPDAPDGEVIDYVIGKKIPSIVFTSSYNETLRDDILSKGPVDYVVKDSPRNIDYLVSLLQRIHQNSKIKVLVADDSSTARLYLRKLLQVHQYQVLMAGNGEEALALIDENPDIKLLITDYEMPRMNGLELTERVRRRFEKSELVIIGISAAGKANSARFIKHGANDFITKPFVSEEFYCRINQNMELMDQIHQLVRARDEAQEATRLKDKFVSLVSHDLRSPFSTILGFLEILQEDEEHPLHASQRELIEGALARGRSLIDLIEELLDISKLKMGKVKPEKQFIDAHLLAAKSVSTMETPAGKKGILLENSVPLYSRIYADPDLMGQVLCNLLSNSIKFCKEGDKVTLTFSMEEFATIKTTDTGVGISADRQKKLFLYEETTSTRGTAGEKGTGLGLPLCKDIMESMGGSLEVHSTQGRGSSFTARLPIVRPKVLLVEDSRAMRAIVKDSIATLDVDVMEASNGKEGLNIIKRTPPHLVITDIEMPVMDGFTLLKEIRATPSFSTLPVIVLTGDRKEETRDRAFLLDADDFANKKFDNVDFLPRVRKFLS